MPLTTRQQKLLDFLLAKSKEKVVPKLKLSKTMLQRLERRLNIDQTVVVIRTKNRSIRVTSLEGYKANVATGKKLGALRKKKGTADA